MPITKIEQQNRMLDLLLSNAVKNAEGIASGGVTNNFPNSADLIGLTDSDLLAFLSKLEAALHWETKKDGTLKDAGQVQQRVKALRKISDFVRHSQARGVFAKVDKNIFAYQLAVRARSPRLIDQKGTLLCGPAAIVYDLAKRQPDQYVDFAISLFTTGSGALPGKGMVRASAKIQGGYIRDLLPEADYVVLATLRGTDAIAYSPDYLRALLTLTKPAALCEFLTRTGYSSVEDHTFLHLGMSLKLLNTVTPFPLNARGHDPLDRGEQNLKAAQNALVAKERLVIMLAEGAVAEAMKNGKDLAVRTGSLPADATHWTAIRKLEFKPNNKVSIKLMSWGGTHERTLDKDALLSRYAGYVCAKP